MTPPPHAAHALDITQLRRILQSKRIFYDTSVTRDAYDREPAIIKASDLLNRTIGDTSSVLRTASQKIFIIVRLLGLCDVNVAISPRNIDLILSHIKILITR